MNIVDIAHLRLANQQLSSTKFSAPADIVSWFGAVQAQDYPYGKWAIGLRLPGCTDRDVEQAIAGRTIVRTWPMRNTLHFVAAQDIRWILGLLNLRVDSPRAHLRARGLDEGVFSKARKVLVQALEGGRQLTRPAIYRLFESAGIISADMRGLFILNRLAQEGTICFATHEGKQPTFALLEEWVSPARQLEREEALAELAKRYFTSHGPATVRDFAWWSGLSLSQAQAGLEECKSVFVSETVDGNTYWMPEATSPIRKSKGLTLLLPNYDEYLVAYTDRSAARVRIKDVKLSGWAESILDPAMLIDGQVVGSWKRTAAKDLVSIHVRPFIKLTATEKRAFVEAAGRYGKFLEKPVTMEGI